MNLWKRLKPKLASERERPPIVQRVGDLTERWRTPIGVGGGELWRVGEIDGFGAENQ